MTTPARVRAHCPDPSTLIPYQAPSDPFSMFHVEPAPHAKTGVQVTSSEQAALDPQEAAERVFGAHIEGAHRFVELLQEQGVERGLIGPRELDRLWDRHILNSAVLSELIPENASVVDVGAGGGFPGIPLAIARPDLQLTLLEPMARRIAWLEEVVEELGLDHVDVVRGRAEEKSIREAIGTVDVVTARAVAPLGKLTVWCLPLVRSGGVLLALKGSSAQEEITRDAGEIRRAGGEDATVRQCGVGIVDTPTTVVAIRRRARVVPTVGRSRGRSQRQR